MKQDNKLIKFLITYYYTILVVVIMLLVSGCSSTKNCYNKKLKKCCEKTAQAVYDHEGLTIE